MTTCFTWPRLVTLLGITATLLLGACKSDTSSTVTPTTATVTGITCGATTFSTTAVGGAAYTGTATVPYTGGSGVVAYAAQTAIASTGVTGLSATLQAGTLASGAGNLLYSISGTPSASGTAVFALSFGGQSCSLSLPVSAPGSTTTTTDCSTATTRAAKVACAANAFLATLTTAQKATVQLALTKANAIKWSNLPGGVTIRNGLEFSTLTAVQLAAAKAVIAAAAGTTANEGYDEFLQINAADDVLATKAGSGYSSGKYIIAFLGTPSATGTWMLQFGGHHYAQNITYNAGAVASSTPSHQGIEPKTWTTGTTTYAPLNTEHDAMIAMLAALSSTQLATAKLSTTFSDVLLGPNKDGQFPATKLGLAVSTLTAAQKLLVLAAIKPWTQDVDDATGTAMLAIYEKELDATYIAYSGNAALTSNADYVRIDGPSVWVEFVCQSGVVYQNEIHYHTVYRDHTRDYNGL
ncbi:DUF3500 domain-containing protein [Fibrella arboris]|uniref:DUF3500 domain-containing protein n=1 Tax=Fibrella arboris TaxID=3242486 RepID=UPI0035203987